jgi:hypothetical protein
MSKPGNQLRSWKDIAAFLDVHERTVRRWERTRQLPVHRVGGRERDAVFANVEELEAWIAAGGKNHRAGDAASRNDGDPEPDGKEASHDDRGPHPNGEVPSVAEPNAGAVTSVAARGRPGIRQTMVVAGGIALIGIGIVVAVALEVRGRTRAPETGPGPAPPASKAASDIVPSAPSMGASIVVLRISNLNATPVELALPEGVSGRTGGGASRPALLMTARLADAGLRLEIRRADGQPVKPGGSPGQPVALLLQRGVSVRVLTPYVFDVEWVRTEAAPPQR